MRSRKDENDTSKLPFQLGELVLCRYSTYPFWPATIDMSHQKKYNGKFFRWVSDKEGKRVLIFWCTFSNEDTGGWVRADRMIRFHPRVVSKVTVDSDHDQYDAQQEALQAAEKDYQVINKGKEEKGPPEVPDQLLDLDNEEEEEDDDLGLDEEGSESDLDQAAESDQGASAEKAQSTGKRRRSHTGPRTLAVSKSETRPKAKKEPRKGKRKPTATPQSPRAKKKARGNTQTVKTERKQAKKDTEADDTMDVDNKEAATIPKRRKSRKEQDSERTSGKSDRIVQMERELESRNATIAKLKRSLRKHENQLAELELSQVVVKNPPQPDVIDLPMPSSDKYRSEEMDSKTFTGVVSELKESYEKFQSDVNDAGKARQALETETKAVKNKIRKLINDVTSAEKNAVDSEMKLAQMLKRILVADIKVVDLRAHKAGNFIKAMSKKCKEMQVIHTFCEAIYSTWMDQVLAHLDGSNNNDGIAKKSQEDPKSKGEPAVEKDDSGPTSSVKKEEDGKGSDEEGPKDEKQEDKPAPPGKDKEEEHSADVEMTDADEEDEQSDERKTTGGKGVVLPERKTIDNKDVAQEGAQKKHDGQAKQNDSSDEKEADAKPIEPGEKENENTSTEREEKVGAAQDTKHTGKEDKAEPKDASGEEASKKESVEASKQTDEASKPASSDIAKAKEAGSDDSVKSPAKGSSSTATGKEPGNDETPRSVTVAPSGSKSETQSKSMEKAGGSKGKSNMAAEGKSQPSVEKGGRTSLDTASTTLPPSAASEETAAS